MTITCGECGQAADLDKWTETAIAGQLPRNTYQCPTCHFAFERVQTPGERYPNGFYMPGPVKLVPVEARL
jgi:hypothetical protein